MDNEQWVIFIAHCFSGSLKQKDNTAVGWVSNPPTTPTGVDKNLSGCLKQAFNPACHCETDAVRRSNPVLPIGKTNAVRRFNSVALSLLGSLKTKTRVIARFFRRKNRGNPVLPTGKTNAVRRFNSVALSLSGYLKSFLQYAVAKPCVFVLMTASLNRLPRFELSFKSRNDTVFFAMTRFFIFRQSENI